MNIKYDKIADAVYVTVGSGKVANTAKISDRILLDTDQIGNVVGIELLDASSQQDLIANLEANVSGGIPVNIIQATPAAA